MTTDTAPAEQDDPADYNLDGYRMGYAAGFPAGITGIPPTRTLRRVPTEPISNSDG